jgi:hypothetical protein
MTRKKISKLSPEEIALACPSGAVLTVSYNDMAYKCWMTNLKYPPSQKAGRKYLYDCVKNNTRGLMSRIQEHLVESICSAQQVWVNGIKKFDIFARDLYRLFICMVFSI